MPGMKDAKPLLKAHEDPDQNPYLREPVRVDPTTGQTLHYVRWDSRGWPQGHFVRRLDRSTGLWGEEFVMTPAEIQRTVAGELPAGIAPPC